MSESIMIYITIGLLICLAGVGLQLFRVASRCRELQSLLTIAEQEKFEVETESAALDLDSVQQIPEKDSSDEAQRILSEAFHLGGSTAEETGGALANMREKIESTGEMIGHLDMIALAAQDQAKKSHASMTSLEGAVSDTDLISSRLNQLGTLMEAISENASAINKISSQAELLSFNAAIEAARAGTSGRGFAVVAEDVKRLANLSAESARSINAIVKDGKNGVSEVQTEVMDKLVQCRTEANSAIESYELINDNITTIVGVAEELKGWSGSVVQYVADTSEKATTGLESISHMLSSAIGVVSDTRVVDLQCEDVVERLDEFNLIDVRRSAEYDGDLGHVAGSTLNCLQDNFREQIQSYDKDKPYLFICRSGGRSARAARIALVDGFKEVYNLEGGMLRWNELGLDIKR